MSLALETEIFFMKISEKIKLNTKGLHEHGAINIVVFGDSITHGTLVDTTNYESVYWNILKQKLNRVRDYVPVNVINSAISGTTAISSVERLERDVLSHHPDLVIVCFGLNDVNGAKQIYLSSLETIFKSCKNAGLDIIFMTPNMLNTYVADDTPEMHREYAKATALFQNDGKLDDFIYSAIDLAKNIGVTVCDCYSEWKKLYEKGVDTTKLLINRINHPTPEMHKLFADMLFDIIMKDSI